MQQLSLQKQLQIQTQIITYPSHQYSFSQFIQLIRNIYILFFLQVQLQKQNKIIKAQYQYSGLMAINQQNAKLDLFQFDQEQGPAIYDPYRIKNILKDSQTNNVERQRTRKNMKSKSIQIERFGYSDGLKKSEAPENYRRNLKKLLQKLQSLPSPTKQITKTQSSNTVHLMCLTQTMMVRQKKPQKPQIRPQSRPQRKKQKTSKNASKKSKLFSNSILSQIPGQSQLQINKRPLKTMTSSSSTEVCIIKNRTANILTEEDKVRKLIRQKLFQKKQKDEKNRKNSNLLNFLKENNQTKLHRKNKLFNQTQYKQQNYWENTRKLNNLLLFE